MVGLDGASVELDGNLPFSFSLGPLTVPTRGAITPEEVLAPDQAPPDLGEVIGALEEPV